MIPLLLTGFVPALPFTVRKASFAAKRGTIKLSWAFLPLPIVRLTHYEYPDMPNWKKNAILTAAVVSTLLTTSTVLGDDKPAASEQAPAVQAEQMASVSGVLTLPEEVPDWFLGGEMSLDKAIVQLEKHGKSHRLPYPSNYSTMTIEARKEWFAAFKKTQAYKDHQEKVREAYENRLIIEVPVNADGTFLATGLEPGRYNVFPIIPHANSTKKLRQQQAWAANRGKQITIQSKKQQLKMGMLNLEYFNVVMPGDTAPQWTAKDFEGNTVKLSDFKGKYVLLDFWATWCTPCIAEIPNLKETYKAHGGDQFEIIALSLDQSMDLPIEFTKTNPSPYTQLYAGAWFDTETVTRDFGIKSVPSIWLIGPDGKVIARDLHGQALKDAVKKSLSKTPATN